MHGLARYRALGEEQSRLDVSGLQYFLYPQPAAGACCHSFADILQFLKMLSSGVSSGCKVIIMHAKWL